MKKPKNPIVFCNICKLAIDRDKEEHAQFIHFINSKTMKSDCFYHVKCFRERILGSVRNVQLQDKAETILNNIGRILTKNASDK